MAGRSGRAPRENVIAARVSDETMEVVRAWQRLGGGLSVSRAVEDLVARHAVVDLSKVDASRPVLTDEDRDHLERVYEALAAARVQLQRIGNNVNQIARAVNSRAELDVPALAKIVQSLDCLDESFRAAVEVPGDS